MIETRPDTGAPLGAPPAPRVPADDQYIRRFLRIAHHVRSFAPHYAVLAVVVLIVALMNPLGSSSAVSTFVRGAAAAIGSSSPPTSAAVGTTDTTSPSATSADALSAPAYNGALAESSSSFAASAPSTGSAVDDNPPAVGASTSASTTEPVRYTADGALTIIASGYASATAGAPTSGAGIPDNGLPVGATATAATYETFVKLTGNGTALHLALVPDNGASAGDSLAKMTICPITDASWKPARNEAMADAPKFSTICSPGARQPDGTWVFDLGPFDQSKVPGFAIIPTADAQAFQVTFSIKTLPPAKG